MKTFTSALLFLTSVASASPVMQTRQYETQTPYQITEFSASKVHNSGYCNYAFTVSTPSLSTPSKCTAYLDSGFSGSTHLAYVYEDAGKCDNAAVSWTFFDPTQKGDATFNVTVDGVRGTYTVPATDITVSLNQEPNPFDNDVAYTGPQSFSITKFE